MLIPFHDGLYRTSRFDQECRRLADSHYSRQSRGARQFMPNGSVLVLRDAAGLVVFGWLYNTVERVDHQDGVNCTIFRNESPRRSSEIILEAEAHARAKWGEQRFFTYVDPSRVASRNPGYCFKAAGWRHVGESKSGKHLLEKRTAREGGKP